MQTVSKALVATILLQIDRSSHAVSQGTDLTSQSVLLAEDQCTASTEKQSSVDTILGYVTPWNAKGYEIAEKFRAKFSHIAPVWLQLHWAPAQQAFSIQGKHDIDQMWMQRVKAKNEQGHSSVRIVPRVLFELDQAGVLQLLSQPSTAVDLLIDLCIKEGFEGLVIETWSQWSPLLQHPQFRQQAIQFMRLLGEAMHRAEAPLELILAVPPFKAAGRGPSFAYADFQELKAAVDFFSLMTYDASPLKPGPNAPWPWLRSNIDAALPTSSARDNSEAPQLLLGLNFYGNDFTLSQGGNSILAPKYLDLLEQQSPKLTWDKRMKEHSFEYEKEGQHHRVYFPSVVSVSKRCGLAERYGMGLAVWELGQGLEQFYEIL